MPILNEDFEVIKTTSYTNYEEYLLSPRNEDWNNDLPMFFN